MSGPFIFARCGDAPDLAHPSLTLLARAIDGLRVAAGSDHGLAVVSSYAARPQIPNGACVSVRLKDGTRDLRGLSSGSLLGYAFIPGDSQRDAPARLLAAIKGAAAARVRLAGQGVAA